MRSVLLTLMVSVTQVQLSPCPPSCVVCTEEATICTRLSSIIEVPQSTKAFMLTDGLIDSVDSSHLLDLRHVSVLVLSYNIISTVRVNAFQNLTTLRTLLLDHNRISGGTLDRSTFSWTRDLETLGLGHNALREVCGSWFEKNIMLKTLLLQGNFLTGLNSGTFALSDLRNLEILDLSGNLISHVDSESFRELPRLRRLDLSRNRLKATPGALVDLPSLSVLNLELNDWSCSCELVDLTFLSTDDPSVRTLLDLTAGKSNVSMVAVATRSVPTQRYTRDVALASALACLGGVVITLAVLAIVHRKLSRKCQSCRGKNGAEVQSGVESVQWNFSEGLETLPMSCALHNSHCAARQPRVKDKCSLNTAADFTEDLFVCQNCGAGCLRPRSRRDLHDDWPNQAGEDHRNVGGHQSRTKGSRHEPFGRTGRDSRGSSIIRTQQPPLRRETSWNHEHNKFLKHHQTEETPTIHQTLNCSPCLQAYEYRPMRSEEQACVLTHPRNGTLPGSRVILYRNALDHSPSDVYRQSDGQSRVQRSVSFDLDTTPNHEPDGPYGIHRTKVFKTLEQERIPKSAKTNRTDSKVPKLRSAGQRKLKMKFNLNPFRRTQVHPRPGGPEVVDADNTPKKVKGEIGKPQKSKVKKKSRSKAKPVKDKATKNDEDLKQVSKSFTDTAEHPEGGSDLLDESEDAAITQLLKLTTTDTHEVLNPDSDLPPSTLEDNGSKKHLEDSAGPGLGSDLALSQALGTTHPMNLQETVNPTPTNPSTLHSATSQPFNPGFATDHRTQDPDVDLNLPASASEVQPPSAGFITQSFSNHSLIQEYPSSGGVSPKRKITLIVPEKASTRPQSALDKKIR